MHNPLSSSIYTKKQEIKVEATQQPNKFAMAIFSRVYLKSFIKKKTKKGHYIMLKHCSYFLF